jgi:hypothetical protein
MFSDNIRLVTSSARVEKSMRAAPRLACSVAAVAYVVVRLLEAARAEPVAYNDTLAYLAVANSSLLAPEFWTGIRPVTVPLLYKLLDGDPHRIVLAQHVIAAAGWLTLALALASRIRSRVVQSAGIIAVLAMSLSPDVLGWDSLLLSESLALSLSALLLAAFLLASEHRLTWTGFLVLTILGFLWAASRDTHGWLALALAVILGALGFARRLDRRWFAVALVFGALWLWNEHTAGVGAYPRFPDRVLDVRLPAELTRDEFRVRRFPRWEFPFLNVLVNRVLPNPEAMDFFRDAGMPVTPALLRFSGQYASSENWGLYLDPELEPFRGWIRLRGKRTYMRYLLSRPMSTAGALTPHLSTLTSPRIPYLAPPRVVPSGLAFPWGSGAALATWSIVVVLAAAVLAGRSRSRDAWTVPAIGLLLMPLYAALIWHGDAMEVHRHSVPVGVLLRLNLVLLSALVADALAEWRRRCGQPASGHSS